jgi:hypothetical protein
MPVYEYEDEKGDLVELVRPVAQRDAVPPNLRRITVPRRVAVHGTSSSPMDPESAVKQVPEAFRSLSRQEERDFVRESGFTVDQVKKTWGM